MHDKGHQGRRDQHRNTAAAASRPLGFFSLTRRWFPLLVLLLLLLAPLLLALWDGGGLHRCDRLLHVCVVERRRGRVTFHQRVVAGVVVGEESPHVDAGRDRAAALPLVVLVPHLLMISTKRGCVGRPLGLQI
jgi:hypothetical protein